MQVCYQCAMLTPFIIAQIFLIEPTVAHVNFHVKWMSCGPVLLVSAAITGKGKPYFWISISCKLIYLLLLLSWTSLKDDYFAFLSASKMDQSYKTSFYACALQDRHPSQL